MLDIDRVQRSIAEFWAVAASTPGQTSRVLNLRVNPQEVVPLPLQPAAKPIPVHQGMLIAGTHVLLDPHVALGAYVLTFRSTLDPVPELGNVDAAVVRVIDSAPGGIIGIGGGPYATNDTISWPTVGYDSPINHQPDDEGVINPELTKAQWIGLAELMLSRWSDFRRAVEERADL
jgi:hypothetical protein